ncbi:MAG: Ty1/Copia family ribonuclease HI, partial [Bacteroidota bacterium]
TPSMVSIKMKKNEKGAIEPSKYRSLVGKALYLNKISRPDISNQVRELSQHFDNPGEDQWKQLLQLISYLKATREMGLVMKVEDNDSESCRIECFVDSDFATDTESRRSTTGYLVFVDGALVSWKSKRQGSVTLSSTEAEYVALSQVACEMKFVHSLLSEMGIKVDTPMIVHEDNQGAIFLAKNEALGQRTKHIDTRYHFTRELIQLGLLNVVYIKSEENMADTMTKNLNEKLFWRHTGKMMSIEQNGPPDESREDVKHDG